MIWNPRAQEASLNQHPSERLHGLSKPSESFCRCSTCLDIMFLCGCAWKSFCGSVFAALVAVSYQSDETLVALLQGRRVREQKKKTSAMPAASGVLLRIRHKRWSNSLFGCRARLNDKMACTPLGCRTQTVSTPHCTPSAGSPQHSSMALSSSHIHLAVCQLLFVTHALRMQSGRHVTGSKFDLQKTGWCTFVKIPKVAQPIFVAHLLVTRNVVLHASNKCAPAVLEAL